MKREVSKNLFPWEHIDFHEQIINYFAIVRELPNMGLNPKLGMTNEHVTNSDIEKVFGPNCFCFKTTNLHLHVDNKRKLVKLY